MRGLAQGNGDPGREEKSLALREGGDSKSHYLKSAAGISQKYQGEDPESSDLSK